jgi:hypothetical protein
MEENKIEEGYKRFNEFENTLLNVKEVTWKEDDEIQSQIHPDILVEKFGEDNVQSILAEKGVEIKYLSNHDAFREIFQLLNK